MLRKLESTLTLPACFCSVWLFLAKENCFFAPGLFIHTEDYLSQRANRVTEALSKILVSFGLYRKKTEKCIHLGILCSVVGNLLWERLDLLLEGIEKSMHSSSVYMVSFVFVCVQLLFSLVQGISWRAWGQFWGRSLAPLCATHTCWYRSGTCSLFLNKCAFMLKKKFFEQIRKPCTHLRINLRPYISFVLFSQSIYCRLCSTAIFTQKLMWRNSLSVDGKTFAQLSQFPSLLWTMIYCMKKFHNSHSHNVSSASKAPAISTSNSTLNYPTLNYVLITQRLPFPWVGSSRWVHCTCEKTSGRLFWWRILTLL